MNTKNLDTFITLTKYNSINAAADALFISSPALQQQINRLESEIGFKLFERGAAGIRLTPAGETFLDGVIKLRSDTESLLARCRETRPAGSRSKWCSRSSAIRCISCVFSINYI